MYSSDEYIPLEKKIICVEKITMTWDRVRKLNITRYEITQKPTKRRSELCISWSYAHFQY